MALAVVLSNATKRTDPMGNLRAHHNVRYVVRIYAIVTKVWLFVSVPPASFWLGLRAVNDTAYSVYPSIESLNHF